MTILDSDNRNPGTLLHGANAPLIPPEEETDMSRYQARPGELKLLRERISGHCHRVELYLRVLGLRYETVDINLHDGEANTAAFRQLNPLMQVPVLFHGPKIICDSNAILSYLTIEFEAWNWWPQDPLLHSRVQRWLSIAAGELLNGPVIARRIAVYNRDFDQARAVAASTRFLNFLEEHLLDNTYLVNDVPTVADIAVYTYTAHAPEGGISLQLYRSIDRWLRRIEAWPAFVPMPASPIPAPLNV
jgi:glutathione S-transferase